MGTPGTYVGRCVPPFTEVSLAVTMISLARKFCTLSNLVHVQTLCHWQDSGFQTVYHYPSTLMPQTEFLTPLISIIQSCIQLGKTSLLRLSGSQKPGLWTIYYRHKPSPSFFSSIPGFISNLHLSLSFIQKVLLNFCAKTQVMHLNPVVK